jgi:signal transduction histidine kinase
MVQLWQNLIGNAIKFQNGASPKIHIGAKKEDKKWQLSVKDNGIGIDPKAIDKIFGVFQRSDAGRHYPGTGIGLAVCKRIVERHNGIIWAESEVNKGTTFYFEIPILHGAN